MPHTLLDDPTRRGSSLMAAAKGGHVQTLDLLVRAGADVHKGSSYGFDYENPLHIAIQFEHLEATRWLLDHGANATMGTWGFTAACRVGPIFLFQHGAAVTIELVCLQALRLAGPLWWVVRHSLGLQGWEVLGMIDLGYGNGVPPLPVQAEAWKGAGVVVGVSLVDRLRSRSPSGGRREGGTRWSHECGILTTISIRLSPVGFRFT